MEGWPQGVWGRRGRGVGGLFLVAKPSGERGAGGEEGDDYGECDGGAVGREWDQRGGKGGKEAEVSEPEEKRRGGGPGLRSRFNLDWVVGILLFESATSGGIQSLGKLQREVEPFLAVAGESTSFEGCEQVVDRIDPSKFIVGLFKQVG